MFKRPSTLVAAILAIAFTAHSYYLVSGAAFTMTPDIGGSIVNFPKDYPMYYHKLSDTVPYRQYVRAEDSVRRLEQDQRSRNLGNGGTGSSANGIGTLTFEREPGRPKEDHYLQLGNFKYTDDMTQFLLKDGKFFLLVPKWRKVDSNENKTGDYVYKPVKVRYAESKKSLLIPVSASMKSFYDNLTQTLLIVHLLVMGIAFVFTPACILFNIAQRKAFVKFNYQGLYVMGITLFAFVLLRILTPYIFMWVYNDIIPSDIRPEALSTSLITNLWPFIEVIVFMLAGAAFWRGYKLEKLEKETY